MLFSPQGFRGEERPALRRVQDCLPEMKCTVCYLPNPDPRLRTQKQGDPKTPHIIFPSGGRQAPLN